MGKLFEDVGADEFQGLDMKSLHMDQAWLRINSQLDQSVGLYARSDDCYQVSEQHHWFVSIVNQNIKSISFEL